MIAVESGNWPSEPALKGLARRAIDAASAALAAAEESSSSHLASSRASAGEPPHGPADAQQANAEDATELSILFTDDEAIRKLNLQWREKDKPTNVLSFPQAAGPLLGDVILGAETVAREAALADKTLEDHMAHLLIHGYLHLLGFDHEADEDAEKMEQLERVALKSLGISDPYAALPGQ